MNNKVEKHKGNKVANKRDSSNPLIKNLQAAEEIAEFVVNSSTFGTAFEKREVVKDDKGDPKPDKDGNKQYVTTKNKNDVVAAIMVGQEIGLSPMASITMGGKLNSKAFTKVKRGEALGIDPITALDVVDIIPSNNGDMVSLGVHIISKVLIDNGVKIEFLEDYKPVYVYYKAGTTEEIDLDDYENYFVITKEVTKEQVTAAQKAGKLLVVRKYTRRTTVRLTRYDDKGNQTQSITKYYTLQMATDAGLYKGTTTTGETVEGKGNWNNHPYNMLTNRPLTIAGRIIISDKLYGTYSKEEVSEFTDYELADEEIENAKDYTQSDEPEEYQDTSEYTNGESKNQNEVNEDTTK